MSTDEAVNISQDSEESKLKKEEDTKEEDNNQPKVKEETTDLYEYIDKNEFTSERYKIEIRRLPKYYGLGELKKLLNDKLSLNSNKVKSPKNRSSWVYVCFRSEEDRTKALEVLQNYKWKGSNLEAKIADPAPDPLRKRRLEQGENAQSKRRKIETPEQQEEALKASATPLWNVPYEEQLAQKMQDAESLLRRLGSELMKTNRSLTEWIEKQKAANGGLPCKLLQVRSLPELRDHYRNKCEFSIGRNDLTGERVVGFRLGTYASGSVTVAPAGSLNNFAREMMDAVTVFEKFVRASEYEVFSQETLKGHWKQLTVRVGAATGQIMLIVGFSCDELDQPQVDDLQAKIKDFFTTQEGASVKIDSLFFQRMNRKKKNESDSPPEHLMGKLTIDEVMCGLTFQISPLSFFQINTKCMEVVLNSVKELAEIDEGTTVLDVCCGTGVIGLTLAKECQEVLGLEVVQEAVDSAKLNAERNKIENCQFFCGRAEEIISSVVSRVKGGKVVGILDPPRAGLHNKALSMIRKTKNLERIVFLSCDPKLAFKNFTELGRPPSKTLHGLPYVPIAAVPVDMFPHTSRYELIIYFERIDIAKARET